MAFKGNTVETTNTSQNTNNSQTGQTTPWGATNGILSNLLSQLGTTSAALTPTQTSALDTLSARGAAGNQYAPAIGNVASTLLAGGGPDRTPIVNDAYAQYQKALQPFASGSFVDPSKNPALQKYLDVARNDATNSVNSQFAGAGRDLSGLNTQALGRGIGQAEAPILYDAYNQGVTGQRSAIDSLYGAGNTTAGLLSGLDQTKLGNMTAGIGAAGAANDASNYGPLLQLQAESMRSGIPLDTLAKQFGLTLPAAQAFGTTSTTGTGSSTGTGTRETDVPLFDRLLGAGAAAAGLAGRAGTSGLFSGLGSSVFSGLNNNFLGSGTFNRG